MKKNICASLLAMTSIIHVQAMLYQFGRGARQSSLSTARNISRPAFQMPQQQLPRQNRFYGSFKPEQPPKKPSFFQWFVKASLPGSPENEVTKAFNEVQRLVIEGRLDEGDINDLAYKMEKADYNIWNQATDSGYSLLGSVLNGIVSRLDDGSPLDINKQVRIANLIYNYGGRLNEKDKKAALLMPRSIIDGIAKNLASSGLTIGNIPINIIESWANLFSALQHYGIDIPADLIDIPKMQSFIEAYNEANTSSRDPFGVLVIVRQGETGTSVKTDDISRLTLYDLVKILQSKDSPFMNDIYSIMSRLDIYKADGRLYFRGTRFSIPMDRLEAAAEKGILRVSLLELTGRNIYTAPMYKKGTNSYLDEIYSLLIKSNTIEIAQKIGAYKTVLATASFIKSLPGAARINNNFDEGYSFHKQQSAE
jgi:hypothetical protein